jgi:hypothetical protein
LLSKNSKGLKHLAGVHTFDIAVREGIITDEGIKHLAGAHEARICSIYKNVTDDALKHLSSVHTMHLTCDSIFGSDKNSNI